MSIRSTLRTQARLLIPEINSTDALDNTDLDTVLNMAAKEMLEKTDGYPTSTIFNGVADTLEYSITTYISTFGKLHEEGLWWYDSGNSKWLQLTAKTRNTLSDEYPTWRTADAGNPRVYAVDGDLLIICPKLSANQTNAFKLYHYARSTDMSADSHYPFTGSTTELSTLATHELALFDYVKAIVKPMFGQDGASHLNVFYQKCNDIKKKLSSRPDLREGHVPRSAGHGMNVARSMYGGD